MGAGQKMIQPFLQRQDPNARFLLIDNHQSSGCQLGVVLTQGRDHQWSDVLRQDVLAADLQYAWAVRMVQGQHGPEVQVVGKDHVTVHRFLESEQEARKVA
jgi:hypothetical protein